MKTWAKMNCRYLIICENTTIENLPLHYKIVLEQQKYVISF